MKLISGIQYSNTTNYIGEVFLFLIDITRYSLVFKIVHGVLIGVLSYVFFPHAIHFS